MNFPPALRAVQSVRGLLLRVLAPVLLVAALASTPAPAFDASSGAGVWLLEADLRCLLFPCAVFSPSDGSPAMPQGWNRELPLDMEGELRLPSGTVTLRGPGGGRLHYSGPGVLVVRGDLIIPLSAIRARYKHRENGKQASGTNRVARERIGVPPLVAGPEGTGIEFVMSDRGAIGLVVTDGRACIAWMDAALPATPPGDRICLERGQALALEPMDIPERSFQRLEAKAGEVYLDQLSRTVRRGPREERGDTPAGAHQRFLSDLASMPPSLVVARAEALVKSFPDPVQTPRALYLAWLKLEAAGAAEAAQLEGLLTGHFPASIWRSILSVQAGGGDTSPPGVPERR